MYLGSGLRKKKYAQPIVWTHSHSNMAGPSERESSPHLQVYDTQLVIFLFDCKNVSEDLQHGRGGIHDF